jgi:hypothetical protein
MVTSATETERKIRWAMYAIELLVMVGGFVAGYAKLTGMVEQNAKDITSVRVEIDKKLDKPMFDLHKMDDDKRFERIESHYSNIETKLDRLIMEAKPR